MKAKIASLTLSALLGFSVVTFADERSDPYQEGLRKDAEAIADMYQISREDALRRLKLQAAASDRLVVQLKEEFKERFAGMYIEHDPIDRMVVRLKGDAKVADRKLEVDGDIILINFVSHQSHTRKELEEIIDNNFSELKKSIVGLQGTATDDRTGEIILVVYMEKNDPIRIEAATKLGKNILLAPVKIKKNFFTYSADGCCKNQRRSKTFNPYMYHRISKPNFSRRWTKTMRH